MTTSLSQPSLRGYLEHEAELLPVLKGLRRVLLPGGLAVVKVPNYASVNRLIMGSRWCGFRYPDHLNFTPKTLGQLAAEAGFATSFGVSGRLPTTDNIWADEARRVTPRNPILAATVARAPQTRKPGSSSRSRALTTSSATSCGLRPPISLGSTSACGSGGGWRACVKQLTHLQAG